MSKIDLKLGRFVFTFGITGLAFCMYLEPSYFHETFGHLQALPKYDNHKNNQQNPSEKYMSLKNAIKQIQERNKIQQEEISTAEVSEDQIKLQNQQKNPQNLKLKQQQYKSQNNINQINKPKEMVLEITTVQQQKQNPFLNRIGRSFTQNRENIINDQSQQDKQQIDLKSKFLDQNLANFKFQENQQKIQNTEVSVGLTSNNISSNKYKEQNMGATNKNLSQEVNEQQKKQKNQCLSLNKIKSESKNVNNIQKLLPGLQSYNQEKQFTDENQKFQDKEKIEVFKKYNQQNNNYNSYNNNTGNKNNINNKNININIKSNFQNLNINNSINQNNFKRVAKNKVKLFKQISAAEQKQLKDLKQQQKDFLNPGISNFIQINYGYSEKKKQNQGLLSNINNKRESNNRSQSSQISSPNNKNINLNQNQNLNLTQNQLKKNNNSSKIQNHLNKEEIQNNIQQLIHRAKSQIGQNQINNDNEKQLYNQNEGSNQNSAIKKNIIGNLNNSYQEMEEYSLSQNQDFKQNQNLTKTYNSVYEYQNQNQTFDEFNILTEKSEDNLSQNRQSQRKKYLKQYNNIQNLLLEEKLRNQLNDSVRLNQLQYMQNYQNMTIQQIKEQLQNQQFQKYNQKLENQIQFQLNDKNQNEQNCKQNKDKQKNQRIINFPIAEGESQEEKNQIMKLLEIQNLNSNKNKDTFFQQLQNIQNLCEKRDQLSGTKKKLNANTNNKNENQNDLSPRQLVILQQQKEKIQKIQEQIKNNLQHQENKYNNSSDSNQIFKDVLQDKQRNNKNINDELQKIKKIVDQSENNQLYNFSSSKNYFIENELPQNNLNQGQIQNFASSNNKHSNSQFGNLTPIQSVKKQQNMNITCNWGDQGQNSKKKKKNGKKYLSTGKKNENDFYCTQFGNLSFQTPEQYKFSQKKFEEEQQNSYKNLDTELLNSTKYLSDRIQKNNDQIYNSLNQTKNDISNKNFDVLLDLQNYQNLDPYFKGQPSNSQKETKNGNGKNLKPKKRISTHSLTPVTKNSKNNNNINNNYLIDQNLNNFNYFSNNLEKPKQFQSQSQNQNFSQNSKFRSKTIQEAFSQQIKGKLSNLNQKYREEYILQPWETENIEVSDQFNFIDGLNIENCLNLKKM
ncbi:hypothetical protein PPERSA_06199 [Pseudocohnilembus persalinus]|uniref:Transmembrane protein n=1 Tax=Pseudocohnilembus persalinus TaxID=266149 RepID=A0A0V0R1I3_PSEPJ|nr:hypothetical protein PPERSA_06199 [Pseudocohnilembus persalinus]|eukprot:KRX08021.1 hypothetical protein PPERSA_06199 [Pseudocohnilembus persalinus]